MLRRTTPPRPLYRDELLQRPRMVVTGAESAASATAVNHEFTLAGLAAPAPESTVLRAVAPVSEELTEDPLLIQIREWLRVDTALDEVRINGLWQIDCIYQPNASERKFNYNILVAQTLGQGACYYAGDRVERDLLAAQVGQTFSLRESSGCPPIDLALLDSVASAVDVPDDFHVVLDGRSPLKALQRAQIITAEVNRLVAGRIVRRHARVCNVGVVSLLIHELVQQGYAVTGTDMDETIIGGRVAGAPIRSGAETLQSVADSDVAVVTGMTLSTATLSEIIDVAQAEGTKLVLFCETGSGFAPFLASAGVASVVSEPFPFYIFDGLTRIRVFREAGR